MWLTSALKDLGGEVSSVSGVLACYAGVLEEDESPVSQGIYHPADSFTLAGAAGGDGTTFIWTIPLLALNFMFTIKLMRLLSWEVDVTVRMTLIATIS